MTIAHAPRKTVDDVYPSVDKIEMLRKRVIKRIEEDADPDDVIAEVERLVTQHKIEIDIPSFLCKTEREYWGEEDPIPLEKPQAKLLPVDRQAVILEIVDKEPKRRFRRTDLEDITGFSKDQLKRDLRELKEQKLIGYEEVNQAEPHPNNPSAKLWRKDAVYFSLKPVESDLTFPLTIGSMDELLEVVKRLDFVPRRSAPQDHTTGVHHRRGTKR